MKRYMDKLIVGVDAGNFNCKTQTQCFTSGFVELAGSEIRYNDLLEYNGRVYALTSDRLPLRDDKTGDDDFFILTLFAIGKELARHQVPSGEYPVVLAPGLPPGHLTVAGLMDRTQNYYKRQVEFVFNGKEYKLDIGTVIVCPQGFAALLAPVLTDEMEALSRTNRLLGAARPIDILVQEPQAILIDIGGGTTDPIPLEWGAPKPSIKLSMSEGIVDAYNEISAVIKSKTGRDLPENAINMLLNGKKGVRVTSEEAEMIYSGIERYSQHLQKKLLETKLPFSSSYNLLLGGGSAVLKSCWEKTAYHFGKLDFIREIRVNAMGFEEYALKVLTRA